MALEHSQSELWRKDLTGDSVTPTVGENSFIYADRERVVSRTARGGSEQWELIPEDRAVSDTLYIDQPLPPVVENGRVYVHSDAGRVYALER